VFVSVENKGAYRCLTAWRAGHSKIMTKCIHCALAMRGSSHICEEDGPWNARSSSPCRSAKLPQASPHDASFSQLLRPEYQRYMTWTPLLFLALSLAQICPPILVLIAAARQ